MAALQDANLRRLDAGIFILHGVLMAMFVVIPFSLTHHVGLEPGQFWKVYVPVMMLSAIFMFPMIMFAERRQQVKPVFLGAIVILIISQIVLTQNHTTLYGIAAGLLLFFIGFNVLEAKLPSIVSKVVSPESKGTAMGVYSTSQFLGSFVGGTLGGLLYHQWGISSVYMFVIVSLAGWLLLALSMPAKHYTSRVK